MINKLKSFLLNTTVYKALVVCAFMLVPSVFLCFCSSIVSAVLLLWGAILLLNDLISERNFTKSVGSIFLLLFVLGYAVTIVLYAKNDLVSTFNVYFWAFVEFFIIFSVDNKKHQTIDSVIKELYIINFPITIVAFITGILSILCFLFRLIVVMPDIEGINQFWSFGVLNGRNSGVFNNAIPMGNAMFVGLAASLINIMLCKGKSKHIYYSLSAIICFICIITSLNRSHIYGAYLLIGIWAFIFIYLKLKENKNFFKSFIASILCVAVAISAVVGVNAVLKSSLLKFSSSQESRMKIFGYEKIANSLDKSNISFGQEDVGEVEKPDYESVEEEIYDRLGVENEVTLEREEINRLPSFFFPRNELWKIGLKVIPNSPVFGFTTGNRNASSIEYGSGEWFETIKNKGISTYHNAYFDIATSAGLLGLLLILIFLAIHIVNSLKVVFSKHINLETSKQRSIYGLLVGFSAVHAFFISMLFGTLILTNISICIYFWLILGILGKLNSVLLPESREFSIEKSWNGLKGLLKK